MDELLKSVLPTLLANSPYAVVLLLLGRSAVALLRDYLNMVVYRHDLVLERLAIIEKQLGIVPPAQNPAVPPAQQYGTQQQLV